MLLLEDSKGFCKNPYKRQNILLLFTSSFRGFAIMFCLLENVMLIRWIQMRK